MSPAMMRHVYSPSVVCLSFGIAFLGGYLTITFCELLRYSGSTGFGRKVLGKRGLLGAMAISLGGIAIWCMHFVGMSALSLYGPDGERIEIQYNLFPTLISLVIVIIMAGTGLYIASNDIMFGKSKMQIVEIYVKEASKLSIKEIKSTTTLKMLFIISTKSLGHLVMGGVIAGSGVSVMHYLGMWGLLFQDGRIVWDIGIIVASVLIAIIASTAAFWILFRFLSLYPQMELLRIASALVMAIAVNGMHYTGMVAAMFRYQPGVESTTVVAGLKGHFSSESAFFGALLAAVLLGFLLVMIAFAELRFWVINLNSDLRRYLLLVEKLRAEENHSGAIDTFYLRQKAIHSPKHSIHSHSGYSVHSSAPKVHPSDTVAMSQELARSRDEETSTQRVAWKYHTTETTATGTAAGSISNEGVGMVTTFDEETGVQVGGISPSGGSNLFTVTESVGELQPV